MKTASLLPSLESLRFPAGPDLISIPELPGSRETTKIKDWCLARADEWYEFGQWGLAREFLQHAADVDPQDSRVWIALGALHYELGEFQQAGFAFTRGGQLDPGNARVYLHLALTHQQLGHLPEAEALFKHALEVQPDNAFAMEILAGFLMNLGRHAEAREYLEPALQRQSESVELLLRLGACCFQCSDLPVARQCYERVLDLDPSHSLARENLEFLEHCPTATVAGQISPTAM